MDTAKNQELFDFSSLFYILDSAQLADDLSEPARPMLPKVKWAA
jgi:hypothetical protein